jgi:uncharacterized membrane protein YeaQ/YmgE (transglycosylase-associated protein family)
VLEFILFLLLAGLIIGALARLLLPGSDPIGCLATALLGIAGSLVGGLLSDLLFGPRNGTVSLHAAGFVGSVIGAMVLLLILRLFRRR